MAVEKFITRGFGHPFTGVLDWDILEAKAGDEEELSAFIKAANRKFWEVWLRDNTGNLCVVMYKPSGAKTKWVDLPGQPVQFLH